MVIFACQGAEEIWESELLLSCPEINLRAIGGCPFGTRYVSDAEYNLL
jgi:hypothetical protein